MENGTTPLVTITFATLRDLPIVRALWITMLEDQRTKPFYPFPHPEDDDRITQDLAVVLQSHRFCALIARDEHDHVLGFAAAEHQERRFGAPREYGYWHAIYVIPAMRHHSVSLRLCLAMGRWFQEHGLDIVECDNPAGSPIWWRAVPLPFKTAYSRYVCSVQGALDAIFTFAKAHDPAALPEPEPPAPDLTAALATLPEDDTP
jgi:acetyltransferase (GNAT) family protein